MHGLRSPTARMSNLRLPAFFALRHCRNCRPRTALDISARTREEKAVLFALHMTVVEHSRGRRVTHEVLQDVITGYEEHLPFAREVLTNMERMTTAEREAFIADNSSRDSKNLSCSRDGTCVSLASEQLLSDLINPHGWCSSRRW